MKILYLALAIGLVATVNAAQPDKSDKFPKRPALDRLADRENGEKRTLLVLSHNDTHATVRVKPGDVIQIETKQWPVVPTFLDSKPAWKEILTPESVRSGEMSPVQYIGTGGTPVSPDREFKGEGSSSWSIFLYSVHEGTAKIRVYILDKDGKEIDGYSATYTIVVARNKKRDRRP